MSALNLIKTLEMLLKTYEKLTTAAVQKTKIIKKGDLSALQSTITEEKLFLQALQKLESKLQNETKLFLKADQSSDRNITLTECINAAADPEKQELSGIKSALEEQISMLKQQNELNQQLIEQSLQFVNMSIDMLSPEIDSYNYDRPHQGHDIEETKRSIFDSKA
ncbi:flagellar protein FlgN [Bacillus sp. FJAT-29937]|uniref:flagellar protein FlgN n=1 Tax=Bacillus sp. FJAT-29937 TaxID=1720553 RepID=UPI000829C04C|nr:flagellar protein FlgN [Bacillus sp. FJAT-29937]